MISSKLTLNTLKIEFFIISSSAKVKKFEETLCVHVQGEPTGIYKSPYVKSLRFYLDQQCNLEDHVAHVIEKCNSSLLVYHSAK